ncbi:MAG: isoleucine--tRNA ligase [Patescibacteria group bacterium]
MSEPQPSQDQASSQDRAPLFPKIEEEMTAYWKEQKIFERSIKERPADKSFVFYDGPPFATGLPHYGHLLQSILKDAVPRYWTMKGYRVPRVWGWDCHGLPIENLVEKELNLGSKKQIEAHGVDKFNQACYASVFTYEKDWATYIDRIGRWVDFEHSYKTVDNEYIESVWWSFKKLHDQDLVFKGTRTSLYCPRCQTPLSNFEVAMGDSYIDAEDPAITIKFKAIGEEKTYFLAWTTTPWTLTANTGLSVHPELDYVAMKHRETGETLILAEARRLSVLGEDAPYDQVWKKKGSELVGMTYEPLYAYFPVENGHRVVEGHHVSADDGTGIVHTAPGFGEDDLRMHELQGLPIIDSVDDEGKMRAENGPFAGLFIKKADPLVLEDLQSRGLLFHSAKITHSVPICWRCNTLLLYKSQPAWFIKVTSIKEDMLKTAKKINWHPEHFKEGRFGKGLESAPDWNVSRTRYWGTPIPVWECSACDKREVIGSIEELQTRTGVAGKLGALDLHRPNIDTMTFACSCGGTMSRIPEVFDCWFESGSMPVASVHYPFENKKFFEDHFPADFIAEGQDQTRGWFYTLHVLATALFGEPAFKNVVVTGMVLAEDGKKMSKRLKNYPDPADILTNYGGDALRYYLLTSPIIEAESLNFSERDLQTVVRGFLNLFWNVKTFYEMYATENVKLEMPRSGHVLDRWLFSRYSQLVKEVTQHMEAYEIMKAARPLRDFVDDLSTWWLRRSRDRMKSENAYEKMDALKTLREILEEFAKLSAPIIPFLAEKVYLDIGGQKASVHLEKWPSGVERLIDEKLMNDMRWVREVVSKAHEARSAQKVPVRQALGTLTVVFAKSEEAERLRKQSDLLGLIRDEVNVERIVLEAREGQTEAWIAELDATITPELKRKGLRREFSRHVMNLRKESGLQPADRIQVVFQSTSTEIAEAVEEGVEELKRDIRADSLARVESVPTASKAHSEVKLSGEPCLLWLV